MGILMVGMVNPEIDRHISKKLKKTKLPGKTSWKVPIWLFLFCEWPSSEKNQHCQLFQITSFDCLSCLSYSSRRLVVFLPSWFTNEGLVTTWLRVCMYVCMGQVETFVKFEIFTYNFTMFTIESMGSNKIP